MRAAHVACRRNPVPMVHMLGWWSADRGHDGNVSTAVSRWEDLTQRRVVSQATGSKQPAYLPLGISGQPAVGGDGTDDQLSDTSASPVNGLSKTGLFVLMSNDRLGNDQYIIAMPESAGGLNGVDLYTSSNASNIASYTKTDASNDLSSLANQSGTDFLSGVATGGKPFAFDWNIDLALSGNEKWMVGSLDAYGYANLTGASLDTSAGRLDFFNFASFALYAKSRFHEVMIFNRPITAGERRRLRQRAARRHGRNVRPDAPMPTAIGISL